MKKVKKLWKNARKKMTRRWAIMTAYQVSMFILGVALLYGVVDYAVAKSYYARSLNMPIGFSVTAQSEHVSSKNEADEWLGNVTSSTADNIELSVCFLADGTPVVEEEPLIASKNSVKLEDVLSKLDETESDVGICINIKETSHLKQLYDMLYKYGVTDRTFFVGVTAQSAHYVKRDCPSIPFYLNISPDRARMIGDGYQQKILDTLKRTGAVGINCKYTYASERLATMLHENGYKLSAWGINDWDQAARILVIGADNVFTASPDIIEQTIENWKKF